MDNKYKVLGTIISLIIFIMIGSSVFKLYKNEMEKYPQKVISYYEEQFNNAGDTIIINKYTDDYKGDIIKYGESKGYKLKETKIENNLFSDDITLIFEKVK
ncbi:hypothetical protein [Fusobacterium hwasookii]|uniref:Uncharacterized protein n=2 Tax=Fusobacterium hwasookii TaxID=1583098 RepID=A0A0S2ZR28_9FUSO|nr:hypothetical protein [Fusobacterium hwasookii]ALQ35361.1 hypothetical protein RN92_05475 [Fusobacterium hwasookii ChDC F206]ALQ41233.1 hypothetical protein RN87_11785 [Fusobacterium hwasookii ChDC F174]